MHSHRRARGKVLFEALCALGLAASFAGAWVETGSSALLASASIVALFAIYWSFGLVARDRVEAPAQTPVAVPDIWEPEAEVETAVREVYNRAPEVPSEPEPVAPAPKKRAARKSKKAAAEVAAVVEPSEPVAIAPPVSNGLPLEQLFDVQPRVREPRPAFGRKARGPRPLSTA